MPKISKKLAYESKVEHTDFFFSHPLELLNVF